MGSLQVSLCIPVYNEKLALRKTIEESTRELDRLGYAHEVIVIDDGSTDGCTREIRDLRNVRIIRHRRNFGGGVARVTGIRYAKAEVILQTDADDTYPVESYGPILEKMKTHDLVIGARRHESAQDFTLLRTFMKWVLKTFASILSGRHIPDLNSGLRAYDRKLALRYQYLYPKGHSIMSTMTLGFLTESLRVHFEPIDYRVRKGRSSFRPVMDTFNYLVTIVRTMAVFEPLRVVLPLAGLMMVGGILFALRNFWLTKSVGNLPPLLMMLSVVTAIQGILSDQLSRLSRQVAKLTNADIVSDADIELVSDTTTDNR